MPRRGRRGYPTAILIGFEQDAAHLWLIYSESVKPSKTITGQGGDEKSEYKFNEELVEDIRSLLLEGFSSLILASELRKQYSAGLLDHIKKRHRWLTEKITIKELTGKATSNSNVIKLIKENRLQEKITEATEETEGKLLEQLEKALEDGTILYTIEELNDAIRTREISAKVLMTDNFNQRNQGNKRFQSTVQVFKNLGATVAIVKTTTPVGMRLTQLGGLACLIET